MKKNQTVEAYYRDRGIEEATSGQFKVYESGAYCSKPMQFNRRDFYKISLLLGSSQVSWHHQDIVIDRPALAFFNPLTPYAWNPVSEQQNGYFCLFKKAFLGDPSRNASLQNSPLFKTGGNPVFFLNKTQQQYIGSIYRKMLIELRSDYVYKYDLLRNQLHLIIHEAMKMEPALPGIRQKNAAERIAIQFLELLEKQFPIDTPEHLLTLRTAGDYASSLATHVNHLNHAVKEVTGQTTSEHIADRILAESKALLKHTDWPVATIAYSLGFETPIIFIISSKREPEIPPKTPVLPHFDFYSFSFELYTPCIV
ncbi:AraC family transcriptional regulator [Paraflavitalea speifideaquila]|uniref:helix-turn-helix domain-containing protein n=1 Tax=Paraflavitalea speifideaquila TaxID=3076558 RepID=UPI0028E8A5A5|nr:AraC family transcriptional regulator [Paraflavitalea speifideiaquila]